MLSPNSNQLAYGLTAEERVDERLHLAGEFLEHEVLVFHLGDEPRRLEQAFAVIPAGAAVGRVPRRDFRGGQDRRRSADHLIDLMLEAGVLGGGDLVDRGEAAVFVSSSAA